MLFHTESWVALVSRKVRGRGLVVAVLVAAMGVLGSPAQAQDSFPLTEMWCLAIGEQGVGPVDSPAFAIGKFVINTHANTLSYNILSTNLKASETMAHIHGPADPGVNAGPLHTLPMGARKQGTWNYDQSQEADILGGRMYINIHSSDHPGGEIRGQIAHFNAILDAEQETANVVSDARGWAVFTIDTQAKQLNYYIWFTGLTSNETMAHIHGMALHNQDAGVLHTLPMGSPKVGTWDYPPEMERAILEGQTYINIHTQNFGPGEIRGQIVRTAAILDGKQEVPANDSEGVGYALVALNTESNQLSVDVRSTQLSSTQTAAHIHGYTPHFINSGVVHGLGADERKLSLWNYPAEREAEILGGWTYVNIHTSNLPGGEIRGQLEPNLFPPQGRVRYGDLNGNGIVGTLDASLILQFDAFRIDCFPVDTDCDGFGPEEE